MTYRRRHRSQGQLEIHVSTNSLFSALGVTNHMKLAIFLLTAIGLSLTCTALADHYKDLAAQGYRWVTVNGPYACETEQDLQRIVAHHTDATELQAVQNIQCYYL